MIDKTYFKKAIGESMRTAGFTQDRQSWYLKGPNTTIVIALQKSDFDEKYYINFGIWLNKIGISALPKVSVCHINGRLASLFADSATKIEKGCNLSQGTTEDVDELARVLQMVVIPFFKQCLVLQFVHDQLVAGAFKRDLVMKVARDALSFNEIDPGN